MRYEKKQIRDRTGERRYSRGAGTARRIPFPPRIGDDRGWDLTSDVVKGEGRGKKVVRDEDGVPLLSRAVNFGRGHGHGS